MAEQGPGWGFMWMYQPWHGDGDTDVYVQGEVFAAFEDARAAALDSGPMRMRAATDGNPSAVSQLRSCESGQDVLISYEDCKDAFAIYRVAPGQSSRSAGMAFHSHWRETLFESLMVEMDDPSGATVWYGWNPRGARRTQSGGGGSCAMLLLALVFLGWLGLKFAR